MKYIKINNKEFPYSLDFQMTTQPNLTSQLTTMAGKNIADVNGWTYADITLSWEWLDSSTLQELIRETDPMQGAFQFTFDDITTGNPVTVDAIRTSFGGKRLPVVENGKTVWVDIQMTVSFPDCYQ